MKIKHIYNIVIRWNLLVLIFISNFSFAQNNYSNNVTRDDTSYVSISGTPISLYMPKGFIIANKFPGIKHPESGAFIIISNLTSSYSAIKKGFNKDGFISQGMELIESNEVKFEKGNGILYKATKKNGNSLFRKWILVLDNHPSAIMINGTFIDTFRSAISNDIIDCLLSAKNNKDIYIDYEDAVDFKLDVTDTKLKFAKYFTGTLIYTVDGNFPTKSEDGTSVKIGSSLGVVEIANPKKFALEKLHDLPYNFIDNPEINPIELDGLSGYEIKTYSLDKKTGIKQLIYQVILYSNNTFYLILGTAYNDFENNLSLFIDVSSSFKRRQKPVK